MNDKKSRFGRQVLSAMPTQLVIAHWRYCWLIALMFYVCVTPTAVDGQLTVRPLALSGDVAPGVSPQDRFQAIFAPVIDKQGNVLFDAQLENSPGGWWQGRTPSDLTPMALWNQTNVATPSGDHLVAPGFPLFAGDRALVTEEIVGGQLLWTGQRGTTQFVADSRSFGDPSSIDFSAVEFNANGTVVFPVMQFQIPNEPHLQLWYGRSGEVTLIAEVGGQAADYEMGAVYGSHIFLGGLFPALNGQDQYAFAANVILPNNAGEETGIWIHDSQETRLVVNANQLDLGADHNIIALAGMYLNDLGEMVFSSLAESTIDGTFKRAIWVYDTNGVTPVVEQGDELPIKNGSSRIEHILSYTAPNANGKLAVTAELENGQTGIWFGTPDNLRPAMLSGVGFRPEVAVTSISLAAINDLDQIVFSGTGGPNLGQWFIDQTGTPHPMFVTDGAFHVADGDVRTLATFGHFNQNLSNDGKAVAVLTFTDGSSGAFLFQAIPEPTTGFLSFLAPCAWIRRARQRVRTTMSTT
ncbi:MAG: hypothetical protein R3E01_34450 [Pirellulaceae bacterium]